MDISVFLPLVLKQPWNPWFWKWVRKLVWLPFFAPPAQVHLPGQAGWTLVPSSVCIQQEAGKTGSSRCCSTGSDWRGWEGSPHWGAYPSWGTDFSVYFFSFSIMKPEYAPTSKELSLAQHVDKAVHIARALLTSFSVLKDWASTKLQ